MNVENVENAWKVEIRHDRTKCTPAEVIVIKVNSSAPFVADKETQLHMGLASVCYPSTRQCRFLVTTQKADYSIQVHCHIEM